MAVNEFLRRTKAGTIGGRDERRWKKGGGSAPAAPDPAATAAAQAQANKEAVRESAKVNRYNQIGPTGSTIWEVDPNSPEMVRYNREMEQYNRQMPAYNQQMADYNRRYAQWQASPQTIGPDGNILGPSTAAPVAPTAPVMPKKPDDIYNMQQRIQLAEPQQKQLAQQNEIASTLGEYGKQLAGIVGRGPAPFSLDGLPKAPWQAGAPDFERYAKAGGELERATYDRGAALLNRTWERDQAAADSRLANQGLPVGSEAYSSLKGDMEFERNRSLSDLAQASVAAGRQEQQRLFGLDQVMRGNTQNDRNAAIQEMLMGRTQPMNELAALLQGSPALGTPTFQQTAQYQVAPPDVMGASQMAYQGALNNYNQGQQQSQNMIGNLFGLGNLGMGAYAAFSDRRLKDDMARIGDRPDGIGIWSFRYLWDSPGTVRVGAMADEVATIRPDAVIETPSGYLAVDYGRLA